MDKERVLVLGGGGFVGRNVMQVLCGANYDCISASRSEGTDLRDPEAARSLLYRLHPQFIINCAAHVGSLNYVTKKAAEVMEASIMSAA